MKNSEAKHSTLNELLQLLERGFSSNALLVDVRVGLHWTMVTLEMDGRQQSGLASSVVGEYPHGEAQDVGLAGQLHQLNSADLAQFVSSNSPTERALGLAAINAGLCFSINPSREQNALELLRIKGNNKRIGMVGHFPFIAKLKPVARELFVLENDPAKGEYPAEAAGSVLPDCQVVAITSMTLINKTFDEIIRHTGQAEFVMLMGPSTPLSPRLFEFGIDCLAGTIVLEDQAVATAVAQGANYRQIHRIGTKQVTLLVD